MTNNEKIMREALEIIAQSQIGVTDKQEIHDMKVVAKKALSAMDTGHAHTVESLQEFCKQQTAPTLPPESAKDLRAEANRVYAEVKACIECNEAHGFTDHENAIDEILCSYKRILEKSESVWRDVRRAALEDALYLVISVEAGLTKAADSGFHHGCKAYRKAIRTLIDTPPKGEGAK